MKLSLSTAFIFAGVALAGSDWTKPCFHGECNYDLDHPSGGHATLQFLGAPHSIADITPAAGWVILDCDANALEQNIRLVCASDDAHAEHCAHLFSQGGPEGKILRLPESCGKGPFVRISKAFLDSDQSIPIHATHKIRRRDGVAPEVHVLSVDTAWDKLDTDEQHANTEFIIVGSSLPGAHVVTKEAIVERGFSEWVSKIITKLKTVAGKVVEGVYDATTIENGNKTEITTTYKKEHTIIDLSAECAGKKVGLKVETYVNVDLKGHVGFAVKGTIKEGIKEFGSLIGWSGDIKGGIKITAEVAGPLEHQQLLVRYGIPPFDWPGIISVGPRFEVSAHINGSLDITGTADIGLNYNIKKIEHVWPGIKGENDGEEGDVQPADPKVNMQATGDVEAKLNVTAGFFPAIVLGLEGFAGQVKAAISLELEPYVRLEGIGKLQVGVDHQIAHPPSKPGTPSSPRKKSREIDVKGKAGASGSFKIVSGLELRGVAVGKLYKFIAGGRLSKKFWRKEWNIVDTGEGAVGSLKTRGIDAGSRPASPAPSRKGSLSRQGSTTSITSTSSTKSSGSEKQPAGDVNTTTAEEKPLTTWRKQNWKCPPAVEKIYDMIFVGNGTKPKWEFGKIYKENVGVL